MKIQVGECFAKVGIPYADVWQVVGLGPAGFAEPHVRLARLRHPADAKTLSVMALRDPRLFRRCGHTAPRAGTEA